MKKLILFSVCFLFLAGCGKKWKKPVHIDVQFEVADMNPGTTGVANSLEFLSGHMKLNEVNVIGDRKQAESIDFTSTTSGTFEFNSPTTGNFLDLDIPQGTYTNFEVLMEIGQGNGNKSIKIVSQYTDSNLDQFTVQFEYDLVDVFRLSATDPAGDINLVEGKDRTMYMSLDFNYWFDAITPAMWDAADHQGASVNSAVFINETDNAQLYELIVNRIGDGMHAEFR